MARLDALVKPGSKAPGIAVEGGLLVVRVRERAIDGAANTACVRALAASLGVAASAIELVHGTRGRRKIFAIDGLTTGQVLERIMQRD